ncbi:MAG: helix-turn-helix domain-containing protein [Defluviitaleaceae bacterium]|nr:helix-turn-helix domain-containing protein [Defluviitaleaceae bacterium]
MDYDGRIIKKVRQELGLNQAELAELVFLSEDQLSRIERGKVKADIWLLMKILELKGEPSDDFWMLYLDSDDYDGYLLYRQLRRSLRDDKLNEAGELLEKLEKSPVSEKGFIKQTIVWTKLRLDDALSDEDKLAGFYKVLKMSKPNFDESKLAEYRLTYQEIRILIIIAVLSGKMKDFDKAIYITKTLIENRENFRTSEDDKMFFFPLLFFNLSNFYGKADKIKDSLWACDEGIKASLKYANYRFLPQLTLNKASGMYLLGEEEEMYKPLLVRAYYTALTHQNDKTANLIKSEAKEEFGIIGFPH